VLDDEFEHGHQRFALGGVDFLLAPTRRRALPIPLFGDFRLIWISNFLEQDLGPARSASHTVRKQCGVRDDLCLTPEISNVLFRPTEDETA